jgi:hypothetical protein
MVAGGDPIREQKSKALRKLADPAQRSAPAEGGERQRRPWW